MTALNETTYKCKFCGTIATVAAPASVPQPTASATTPPPRVGFGGGADVYDKNIGGILELSCQFSDFACAGSGLLINKDGYAITNAHVVSVPDEVYDRMETELSEDE